MQLRTRLTSAVATTVAGALLSLGFTAPPAAATTTNATAATSGHAGGWQRYHAQSFTTAAGDLCPFKLHSEVLFDREFVRTTRTYADGSPRTQEFVGPLVVRIVNRESGRAVVRDLSGRGVVNYRRNGSFDFRLQGPAAVGFHPGDSLRPGYYVLRGEHVVHFAADGTRTMTVDRGTEENLCRTLT